MDWQAISEDRLLSLLNEARMRMSWPERRFWDAISIPPHKWQQHPFGEFGGGFWVVAVVGPQVVWYNDIEDGFNRSRFQQFGTIPEDEYGCNQDVLELPIRQLLSWITTGHDVAARFGPPRPGEFPVV